MRQYFARVPWQVGAAAGWTSLASVGWLAEIHERQSPSAAAHSCACELNSNSCASVDVNAINTLTRDGYCIIEDVLSPVQLSAARRDIAKMTTALKFTDQHSATLRSDRVCWVREDDEPCSSGDG